MSGQSLGLIETIGLTAAVEAADAAVKSANVNLAGYEITKGSGLIVVKLEGEVGAINAAVSAGVAAANQVGKVWAHKVIARTADGIDTIIHSSDTVHSEKNEQPVIETSPAPDMKTDVIDSVDITEKSTPTAARKPATRSRRKPAADAKAPSKPNEAQENKDTKPAPDKDNQ
ncbi:BMC domain-containing protein [Vibrio salinus]|uniref:BMC domain-containing protein n=1 Tax=Vibrio salinus TaxID=2899784 RepID=UPI00356A48F2